MKVCKNEELFHLINKNGTTYEQYLEKVEQISDINFTDRVFNRSYLHVAIEARQREILEDLLKREIDVNIQDKKGNTAAVYATAAEKWDWLEKILDYDPDVEIKNSDGETLLKLVIYYAGGNKNEAIRLKLVKRLLDMGADPLSRNMYGVTPLKMATIRNDMKCIEILNSFIEKNKTDDKKQYGELSFFKRKDFSQN